MPRHEQLARLLAVAKELASSKRGIPLARLAERHGWNLRAVYRDVATIERAGFLLQCDEGRYRLLDGSLPAATAGVTEPELLALFLARQLATPLRTMALGRALDSLWAKLDGVRGTPGRLLPAESAPLTIRSPLAIDYAAHRKTLAVLERAVARRLALSCRYQALSTGKLTSRIVEPGELYYDPGLETLYLIGWCRLRNDVRVFAVHRFRMASLTDERVKPRGEASSRSALRDAFRVWRSDNVERVVIEFTKEAAPEIAERTWHASQTLEKLPDGGVRLTLEVSGSQEIERWVMGYGERAKVVAPVELAERVGERFRMGAGRYGELGGGTAKQARQGK